MQGHQTSLSNRTRIALTVAGMLVPTTLLCALCAAGGQPPAGKPVLAPAKFKNIQVLKKLPADQLIPVMHKIDASLGVRCDYCHVVNPDHTGFDKDDKPTKITARKMILMTDDLNAHQKILNKKASCFMCHHGSAAPQTEAPAG